MLALRPADRRIDGIDPARPSEPERCESAWLPLQQAACELGISAGTARRMIRRGELRNRVVARPGGFAYLVYLPNSWHAQFAAHAVHGAVDSRDTSWPRAAIARLEAEVARVTATLARALRAPAPRGPLLFVEAERPFARYRWLARRRRWWRF